MPPKARGGGRPPKAPPASGSASWLPGERFNGRRLGLFLFATLVVVAGVYDVFFAEAPSLEKQSAAMLERVYDVASQLPPGGAPYRNTGEIDNVARLARAAADELEELDTDALPDVAKAAATVARDVALSLAPMMAATTTAEFESIIRAAMVTADIALHAHADEAHVALILLAATTTNRWANATIADGDSRIHPKVGSEAHRLLLRRAALLEQAIAVQAERPGLRVMYSAALVRLERYDDARAQLDRLLRKRRSGAALPEDTWPWVEWLDAYATERTAAAEPEAAENMHEAASRLKAPPVESFFDGQVHFGAVDPEIIGDIAAP